MVMGFLMRQNEWFVMVDMSTEKLVLPLDMATIRTLIPHSDDMCLLNQVVSVSEANIECLSVSQTDENNPLRFDGKLSVSTGIEYAAQAMALHGRLGLLNDAASDLDDKPKRGYIVVLSKVNYMVDYLHVYPMMRIFCEQLMAHAQGSQYQFTISNGTDCLLEGQALVSLE